MATATTPAAGTSLLDKKMKKGPGLIGGVIFAAIILGGLAYCGFNIVHDMGNVTMTSVWPYVLLTVALLIALGFEFVNGFHDTANAVATVIYTHSLEPHVAVVWSGMWNLIGVLTSSGAVAFSVITLLPVELILQVSFGRGLRDGLRAADRGDPVEPGYLGAGAAGIEFAHHGGFDHRRGYRQPADGRQQRHRRRGMGAGL